MLIVGLDPGLRNIGFAALSTNSGQPIESLPDWRPHSAKNEDPFDPIPVAPSGWRLSATATIAFQPPPKGLDGPGAVRLPHDGNNRRGPFVLGAHTEHAYWTAYDLMPTLDDEEPILAVGFERIPWQLNRADGEGSVGAVGTTLGAVMAAIMSRTRPELAPTYAEANQIRVKQWACELSSDVTQKVPETAPFEAARRMVPGWKWGKGTDHSVDAVLVALYTLAGLLAFSPLRRCGCGLPWGLARWNLSGAGLTPRRWCPNCGHTKTRP